MKNMVESFQSTSQKHSKVRSKGIEARVLEHGVLSWPVFHISFTKLLVVVECPHSKLLSVVHDDVYYTVLASDRIYRYSWTPTTLPWAQVESLEDMRRFVLEHVDFQRLQVGKQQGSLRYMDGLSGVSIALCQR